MTKPQLRVVNSEQPHPRDLARQAVAEFKLDREKDEKRPLPVATDHDIHGAPLLDAMAIEVNARPQYAPNAGLERRRQGWVRRLLRWR